MQNNNNIILFYICVNLFSINFNVLDLISSSWELFFNFHFILLLSFLQANNNNNNNNCYKNVLLMWKHNPIFLCMMHHKHYFYLKMLHINNIIVFCFIFCLLSSCKSNSVSSPLHFFDQVKIQQSLFYVKWYYIK